MRLSVAAEVDPVVLSVQGNPAPEVTNAENSHELRISPHELRQSLRPKSVFDLAGF
jgi:hypothetical protein